MKITRRRFLRSALLASPLAGFACASRVERRADTRSIYGAAAKDHSSGRNPVIVIPGILGSRLKTGDGRLAWGAFAGGSVRPDTPDGARTVALPMREGARLADLRDDIRPDGALDRLKVSFGIASISLDAYAEILATLGAGGYRDQGLALAGAVDYGTDHYSCFQFAYDWRRSCVENAAALGRFIEEKGRYVAERRRREGSSAPVKFDIVAHSMGGLVARYFLMYGGAPLPEGGGLPALTWAGAHHVQKVILVATPSGGAMLALDQLVHGVKFSRFLPTYAAPLLGTMPALYELLPRDRFGLVRDQAGASVPISDPAPWALHQWGLADPTADAALAVLLPDTEGATARRRIAADHLRKCLSNAKHFHAALDRPAAMPAGLRMTLYAGDAVATTSALHLDADGRPRAAATAPGDGTVTRASALLDERSAAERAGKIRSPIPWSDIVFLPEDHLGLTRSPVFSDNVLHTLLET